MSSFYGNMKNNSRASFIFDRIYPTRTAMEAALNAVDSDDRPIGDGIFINRYVLVDYHYALSDTVVTQDNIDQYYIEVDSSIVTTQNFNTFFKRVVTDNTITYVRPASFNKNDGTAFYQKKVFLDRFKIDTETSDTELQETTSSIRETDLYYAHKYTDWQNYHASYDCTVWMKIYADNRERYIMVAELDAKAPILEFIDDAPNCQNGSGHFDVRASTDLNYVYFMPSNWDITFNHYNPEDALERTDTDNTYWYYQDDKEPNELWYEDYVLTEDTEVQSGKDYYTITFEPYQVNVGQSIKNLKCYIYKYRFLDDLAVSTDISNEEYYEYVGGRYVRTQDTVAQSKPYYAKVTEPVIQYMLAEETVALEDVEYFRIANISKVPNLITGDSIASTSGYFELNNQKKTFDSNVEYPYFNAAGFDPKVSTHVSEKGQGISIKKVPSAKIYPQHKFVHAGILTANTYLPNRYYTYNGRKVQVPSGHEYDRDHAYYIKSANSEQYRLVALILNDDGKYVPARALASGEQYYYDEDLSNPSYFQKTSTWSQGTAYYEITAEIDENGTRIMDHEDDTYRVDVYLPSLGNTIADMYDIIYGAPIIQEDKPDYNNLIGYCSKEQWASYNIVGWCTAEQRVGFGGPIDTGNYGTANDYRFNLDTDQLAALNEEKDEENGYIYPVYLMDGNGDYWAGNRIFDLTDKQFNELSPEIYPGLYDIPVYLKTGSNVRPYNNERIKSTLTPPYDNLEGENDISLGWSLTLLKRYLSELRYLAYGQDENGHQIGLQTDWTQENDELIGYIHHRPVIITNFTKTSDSIALPNKQYYRELVKNGEVVYESLSEHYDLLDGDDYGSLNYYYENRKNIMAKVNNDNCETAILQTLFKITPVADQTTINSTNYLNASIWVIRNGIYEKATQYFAGDTYYESKPLEISDYSQWYYQRDVINYIEITANNYENAIGKTIYKDTNGTEWTNNDFIHVDGGKYYYVDWDENNSFDPDEYITNANVANIDNHTVYEQIDGVYVPVRYYGCYYQVAGYAYDPITSSNYDATKQMWKEDNGDYSQVVASDYVVNDTDRYFYQTEDISYVKINDDNFARERAKFKQTGTNIFTVLDNSEFIDTITVTNDDGIEETVPRYYVLESVNNQSVYSGITSENVENIDTYDIYERFEGRIKVSQDLTNLGYTIFELPRTNSNNIEKDRDMYIQCSEYAIFDENTQYYTYDGSRYVKAVYTLYNYDVEPIAPDYDNNGLVQWDNGYQITVDANNTIIERKYSNLNSKSVFDSNNQVNNNVVLYRNQLVDDTLTMKSVHKFSIVLDNSNNTNQDASEIHAALENLRNLNRTDTLNFLNNTLVNNYGATYIVDENYTSWPTKTAEDNNTDFYYAHLIINYTNFDLDVDHFNANKTRYFTVEKVPIEQEDYEIHNIWNSVLERVLQEP